MTKTEIKNLKKRLDGVAHTPELEKAYKEGEMHALDEFTQFIFSLPIEIQNQIVEELKKRRTVSQLTKTSKL